MIAFLCRIVQAQQILKNQSWYLQINNNGTLDSLAQNKQGKWTSIPVRKDAYKGFSFYFIDGKNSEKETTVDLHQQANNVYEGTINNVHLSLEYKIENAQLAIVATAENLSGTVFEPQTLGLKIGISNYMTGYPQWNDVYFPTMLRCEKTHFTGYLQTPDGQLLGVASPDAIASYSLEYNFGYGDPNGAYFYGHRIYTFNLDLLNANPLPARHPQNLASLAPHEKKSWTIYFKNIDSGKNVAQTLQQLTQAPSFDIPVTSLDEGENFRFKIYAQDVKLSVQNPDGKIVSVPAKKISDNIYQVDCLPKSGTGVYTFEATNNLGKTTEAKISVLKSFGWYIQQARLGALKYTQKASYNCENWYGFYSAYLAQQYFPDNALNTATDKRFSLVMSLMYDTAHHWKPTEDIYRIQNHTTTIGILVDKYLADKNIQDLEAAKSLTDWIIAHTQSADGAFRRGKTHYTSVIYIAKSIMELMAAEKTLAHDNNEWAQAYEKHYNSVKRAIDQLTGGFDAVDTEGELTFEDGMISCSALQIAEFALLQTDAEKRKFYTEAAKKFLDAHDCLEQLFINDSRMRGGSLRFWEAQYDVLLGHNFMNSPHGWSAWTTYATYYLYLLTGEEKYLVQTMNALGSGMQLIDFKTGDLRWAFCADPYIKTIQAENFAGSNPDKYNDNQYSPYEGKYDSITIGEQYVNMIADKFDANSSDNDVHEQFKCMAEVVLTSAYVLERKDGSLLYFNCVAKKNGNTIIIAPNEKIISKIHLNLQNNNRVKVLWNKSFSKSYNAEKGVKWIDR
ncbi:hypothetical protein A9P82_04305 [Arachidicoccus ginsenosidimutans]|nr:hypothetical protein A9P82_04305 [Arachidicoccus sp. BS20]